MSCKFCGNSSVFFQSNGDDYCGKCGRQVSGSKTPLKGMSDIPKAASLTSPADIRKSLSGGPLPSTPSSSSSSGGEGETQHGTPRLSHQTSSSSLSSSIGSNSEGGMSGVRKRETKSDAAFSTQPQRRQSSGGDVLSPTSKRVPLAADIDRKKLTETIRQEVMQQVKQEQEILELELASLTQQNDTLTRQNGELKATLDEVMASFESHIEEAKHSKSDLLARLEILEAELNTSRLRVEKMDQAYKSLSAEHAELQIKHRKVVDEFSASETRLRQIESELAKTREQLETLTQHAQTKLRQSAEEYMKVVRQEKEKTELLNQVSSDLEKTRHRAQVAESRLEQYALENKRLTTNVDQLEASLREKSLEGVQLTASFTKSNTELAALRSKADELYALNARYKDEIVAGREELRNLQSIREAAEIAQRKAAQAEQALREEERQNRDLKSKLFDKIETEKQLREQIKLLEESSGKNLSVLVTNSEFKKAKEELKAMEQELKLREQEKQELMNICDDLMTQVDALKSEKSTPHTPTHGGGGLPASATISTPTPTPVSLGSTPGAGTGLGIGPSPVPTHRRTNSLKK